ncbi:hypothetical protein BDQ17DRAFT_1538472 [Cyathus striatus]|nr:hypothetical protein BDQ17DRAFT_1538472 [Cyathus striatus]
MHHLQLPCFISLPFELQRRILHFLSPTDIISIQKTCKRMNDVASERGLWINVLKDMCEENSAFRPTYPIEDMSMEELKLSATRPDRVLSFLGNSEPDKALVVLSSRSIDLSPSLLPEIDQIFLVPGGRYLFVFSLNKIFLYDLLYGDSANPVACLIDTHGEFHNVCTTSDGLGLRVVTNIIYVDNYGDPLRRCETKVFDIYPSFPKPEFVNIATWNHTSQGYLEGQLSICGDFVVILDDSYTVKIWDLVTQKATFWKIPTNYYQDIIVTDTTVSAISRKRISTWHIPELAFVPDDLHLQDAQVHPPDMKTKEFFVPSMFDEDDIQISGLCGWYAGMKTKHKHLFDIAMRHVNQSATDETETSRWMLSRFQSNPPDVSPVESYSLEPCGDVFDLLPSRICNSRHVALWLQQLRAGLTSDEDSELEESDSEDRASNIQQVNIHIGACGELLKSKELEKQYILLKGPLALRPGAISFCPVAGRICYIDLDMARITINDLVK